MGMLLHKFNQHYRTFWQNLFAALPTFAWGSKIQNYRTVFIPAYLKNNQTLHIALRGAFEDSSNRTQFLVVDTSTLKTQIIAADKLRYRQAASHENNVSPGYISSQEMQETSYMRAVSTYTDAPYPLFNDGLAQSESQVKGAFMAVDLCPSAAKLELTECGK